MGECLIVPELVAGITILDAADRPASSLGFQFGADHQVGWPNERRWLREGLFNSPHSATADELGNIYVVEWFAWMVLHRDHPKSERESRRCQAAHSFHHIPIRLGQNRLVKVRMNACSSPFSPTNHGV
jgi:hypothetical protein